MLMNVKGNNELVFNPKDFKCLIRKYMGNEAAVYFGEIVDYANKAVRDAKDKRDNDLLSYEASLESNLTAFADIHDELANISEVLDSKRMSRDKIAHSVREIKKIINEQI